MSSGELEADSPFARRFAAYLAERFPLVRHGVLIFAYSSSNQFLARALTEPGAPMRWDRTSLLGALTLLLFFFHLRVFDEHKDAEEDRRNHPDRLLSRGVISLAELRALGAVAVLGEIALSIAAGPTALLAWLAAFLFSLLMLAEFFVGRRLREQLLTYAALHMLIMPLLAAMIFSFATERPFYRAPIWFWVYAVVGFFVTFNWEISRKIRAPEEEREGVQSYTREWGTHGAAWAVVAVRAIDTALVAAVGWRLHLPGWFYLALVALYGVCLLGFVQFLRRPNRVHARRMELYAGAYIVAFDLILAAALATRFGLVLPGGGRVG